MVTNEDRYTVLERKLMEAESALFGCRAILGQIRRESTEAEREIQSMDGSSQIRDADGLYPGQVRPPGLH